MCFDTVPSVAKGLKQFFNSLQRSHHVGRDDTTLQDRQRLCHWVLVSEGHLCGYQIQTGPDHLIWLPSLRYSPANCLPPRQTSASTWMCVWQREGRGIQVLAQIKGTGVRDRRCRVAWGCGQVVTHLSLLAQEDLITCTHTHTSITSSSPCVLTCKVRPKYPLMQCDSA